MRNRYATLQEGVRPLKRGYNQRRYYPILRLQGVWLDKAGFAAGARVEIEVRSGELVIRPL